MTAVRWAAAPGPQLLSLYRSPPELLETPPRYVLDCVAVNLHNMKAIPSTGERIPVMGLGTASSFSRAARTPAECYAR